jgi:hypothetical protein
MADGCVAFGARAAIFLPPTALRGAGLFVLQLGAGTADAIDEWRMILGGTFSFWPGPRASPSRSTSDRSLYRGMREAIELSLLVVGASDSEITAWLRRLYRLETRCRPLLIG